MHEPLDFIADRAAIEGADELIADFGADLAAREAARRAAHSRRLGNHIHFTRWRRVERAIALLAAEDATTLVAPTLH